MVSLYELLLDEIPLFPVPATKDSDVVEYETSEQRSARLLNEGIIEHMKSEIESMRMQLGHVESDNCDWS